MGLMISGPSVILHPHHVLGASNSSWPKQRPQVFSKQFKMRVTYFSFQASDQKKADFFFFFLADICCATEYYSEASTKALSK